MTGSIDYFLALSSPWTYLAGPRFKDLAARNGLRITYKPYNIMHVFQLNGTKPVGQRPKPVQSNRLRELGRWRDFLGMPLNPNPAHFPVDPTRAGHIVIAAQLAGAEQGKVIDLADGYLRACWVEERDLGDEATLVEVAQRTRPRRRHAAQGGGRRRRRRGVRSQYRGSDRKGSVRLADLGLQRRIILGSGSA